MVQRELRLEFHEIKSDQQKYETADFKMVRLFFLVKV